MSFGRRRRLTKSWWNDVWRDRLLAAMHFIANGDPAIAGAAGHDAFHISTRPLLADVPVSYDATDPPLPSEQDEQGNIVPRAALDDEFGDIDGPEPDDEGAEGEDGE